MSSPTQALSDPHLTRERNPARLFSSFPGRHRFSGRLSTLCDSSRLSRSIISRFDQLNYKAGLLVYLFGSFEHIHLTISSPGIDWVKKENRTCSKQHLITSNPNRNLRFSIGQKTMANTSVNSPRRMLSLSKERASVFLLDPDEKASAFSVFEESGPKPSEVYGFVGSISAVVATAIFLAWAYIPENWLHFVGVTYYPSRYWALAVPAYVMVTVFLAMVFYLGLNFMVTPPPTSLNTMFDEYSRESPMSVASSEGIEHPIEPISDVPIIQINDLMFGRCSKSWKKLKKKVVGISHQYF